MPLYEYHCSKCGRNLEVIQKFSDAPLTQHEGCGGPLEKLLSAPSFQLKGTGWYATDYAKPAKSGSKDEGGPAKPDEKSESKSESKSDSKSDSKGESKSESKSEPSSKETKSDSKPAATKTD